MRGGGWQGAEGGEGGLGVKGLKGWGGGGGCAGRRLAQIGATRPDSPFGGWSSAFFEEA